MNARKAIESLYIGTCDISEVRDVFDPVTKRTSGKSWVTVVTGERCRLSFSSVTSADNTSTVSNVAQTVKLFIKPELVINAGSKVTVTQNDRVTEYVASGEPAVYDSHQEVVLTLGDDKA